MRNTLLRKDINHIKSIVTEASDITVKYIDFNGQEAEKASKHYKGWHRL